MIVYILTINIAFCLGNIVIRNLITDGYYKLNPLDIKTKSDFTVGFIEANGSGNDAINYFITDVYYLPPDSQTHEPIFEEFTNWRMFATSSSINDCEKATLDLYSKRRKCFCIDHLSGELKTTSFFSKTEQHVGGQYQVKFEVANNALSLRNNLPISIMLFSICDNITRLYQSIMPFCDLTLYKSDLMKSNMIFRHDLPNTLYLAAIQYIVKNESDISIGSNVSVHVHKSDAIIQDFYFIYLNATQTVLVTPPIKWKSRDSFFLGIIVNSSLSYLFDIHYIAIERKDFCSLCPICLNLTKQYNAYQHLYYHQCPNNDQYGLVAKYAYCNENNEPTIKFKTAYLNWDVMVKTGGPIPISSNFINDPENETLELRVAVVRPKYGNYSTNSSFVMSHPFCDHLNTSDLFCFNSSTGTLYTTYKLLSAVPDEIFNITVAVFDLKRYPPRTNMFNLKIICESICTKPTNLYRNIIKSCNSEYYEGTFNNYKISITSPHHNNETYFIIGIRFLVKQACDFMEILISKFQQNNTSTAKYFCVGHYALLDKPIIFESECNYKICAKNFKDNILMNVIENFSNLSFVLIKNYDYCSNADCINKFNTFNKSLWENPGTKSTCAEVDIFGITAKYGYCVDSSCVQANLTLSEVLWESLRTSPDINFEASLIQQLQNGFPSTFFSRVTAFQVIELYNRNNSGGIFVNISYQVQGNNRLESCKEISTFKFGSNISVESIKSCDCCMKEVLSVENYIEKYTFPITLVNNFSFVPCESDTDIVIKRECLLDQTDNQPRWDVFNYLPCPPKSDITLRLLYLKQINVTSSNIEKIIYKLNEILQSYTLQDAYQIDLVSQIISNIIKINSFSETVTDGVLKSIDIVLKSNATLLQNANKKLDLFTIFLSQLDILAKYQTKNVTISKSTLAMAFYSIKKTNNPIYIYTGLNENTTSVEILANESSNDLKKFDAYIILPSQLFLGQNETQIYSYAFSKKTLFMDAVDIIDSVVLSATINGMKVKNTNNLISIMFKHNKSVPGKRSCQFYNSIDKMWLADGCNITFSSTSEHFCQCNHLTIFALILNVNQLESNSLSLNIITWIGCLISITGLFLTIVCYALFPKLRVNLAPKILINMCSSLMIVLILFVSLVEQTKPRVLCKTVASLLQFFILSTFLWMSIEGLNLYRKFVIVFHGSYSTSNFMVKSSAFAWGVPLIITIATAATKHEYLGPLTDHDLKLCVVRGVPFYFGILLPIGVVVVCNTIILVLVLKGILSNSNIKLVGKRSKNRINKVRIALSCSLLLGTTWVFAVLAVGDLRNTFQWIFSILNSLQGFFIFLFYTVRNKEVKKQLLLWLGKKKLINKQ